MHTIHKYPLKIIDYQIIEAATVLNVLRVGLDAGGIPGLWAEVLADCGDTKMTIYIVGIGRPMPEADVKHLGSFVQGPFVWHVFRGPDKEQEHEE